MEYNIKLTLPATFMLARIVKKTGTKQAFKDLLNTESISIDELKKFKETGELSNTEGIDNVMNSFIDLIFDMMGYSEEIENDFYLLFAKVSGLDKKAFEEMEMDKTILFFKSFSKAKGLPSFFTQAFSSKG